MPKKTWETALYITTFVFAIAPLWAGRDIPMVDLPQHLHLISVLHRLNDPSTLFPTFFESRGQLTPYLGYYEVVHWLNWIVPISLANRIFLSLYVMGFAGSFGFLLRSLRLAWWPCLLTFPFAYGDSFAWGFVNYCAAIPLGILSCGFFIRSITDTPKQKQWAIATALSLIAVLLFHVQVFAFLGLALPLLLLSTSTSQGPWIKARMPALLSTFPSVLLFVSWVLLRFGQPAEIAPGTPWKAWGPLLSKENLAFNSFDANVQAFLPLLHRQLRDGTDRYGVYLALGISALALLIFLSRALSNKDMSATPIKATAQLLSLAGIAVLLYFILPFDIRGYMYYLNLRYAHLAAPLVVIAIASLLTQPLLVRVFTYLACTVGIVTGWFLFIGFQQFNVESASLTTISKQVHEKPKVMGLIFNSQSGVVTHPVYLHSATVLARQHGGIANFSFALTPHSPLKYKVDAPPTFPSEWNPGQMNYETEGRYYDTFLLRGVPAGAIFGSLLEDELHVTAQVGEWTLVER